MQRHHPQLAVIQRVANTVGHVAPVIITGSTALAFYIPSHVTAAQSRDLDIVMSAANQEYVRSMLCSETGFQSKNTWMMNCNGTYGCMASCEKYHCTIASDMPAVVVDIVFIDAHTFSNIYANHTIDASSFWNGGSGSGGAGAGSVRIMALQDLVCHYAVMLGDGRSSRRALGRLQALATAITVHSKDLGPAVNYNWFWDIPAIAATPELQHINDIRKSVNLTLADNAALHAVIHQLRAQIAAAPSRKGTAVVCTQTQAASTSDACGQTPPAAGVACVAVQTHEDFNAIEARFVAELRAADSRHEQAMSAERQKLCDVHARECAALRKRIDELTSAAARRRAAPPVSPAGTSNGGAAAASPGPAITPQQQAEEDRWVRLMADANKLHSERMEATTKRAAALEKQVEAHTTCIANLKSQMEVYCMTADIATSVQFMRDVAAHQVRQRHQRGGGASGIPTMVNDVHTLIIKESVADIVHASVVHPFLPVSNTAATAMTRIDAFKPCPIMVYQTEDRAWSFFTEAHTMGPDSMHQHAYVVVVRMFEHTAHVFWTGHVSLSKMGAPNTTFEPMFCIALTPVIEVKKLSPKMSLTCMSHTMMQCVSGVMASAPGGARSSTYHRTIVSAVKRRERIPMFAVAPTAAAADSDYDSDDI